MQFGNSAIHRILIFNLSKNFRNVIKLRKWTSQLIKRNILVNKYCSLIWVLRANNQFKKACKNQILKYICESESIKHYLKIVAWCRANIVWSV
jgi:hypothetical protein